MTAPVVNDVVQIGIVVRSAEDTARHYRDLLGVADWTFNEVDTTKGVGADFRWRGRLVQARALIAWTQLGNVELELIEPRDSTSIYAEFLRDHGPGIHHLMIDTADDRALLDRMRREGIEELASGELQTTRFRLLDTVAALGAVIEIATGDPLVPDRSGLD